MSANQTERGLGCVRTVKELSGEPGRSFGRQGAPMSDANGLTTKLVPMTMSRSALGKSAFALVKNLAGRFSPATSHVQFQQQGPIHPQRLCLLGLRQAIPSLPSTDYRSKDPTAFYMPEAT